MGFSSHDCKHCGHPMLSTHSCDLGINEWMKEVVVLTANGSRLIGEHDGYSGVGGASVADVTIPMGGAVWVHEACWEAAGRPGFDDYDGPSDPSEDQGFFFDDDHDMIDPRITDEAERERLLREGVEARERDRYTDRARQVAEWLDPEERDLHEEEKRREPWRHRFKYFRARDDDGRRVKGHWWIYDKLESAEDDDVFEGTEDEVKTHLAARWARFVESDEARAYLEHRRRERAELRHKAWERLKVKGRYEVSYGPAPAGDTVRHEGRPDWTGHRSIYRVEDRLAHETVAVMDGPDKALGVKTFVEDPDYDGNNSPEWEARVEEIRAAHRESRRLAEEECQRLNDQWARDGHPLPEKSWMRPPSEEE